MPKFIYQDGKVVEKTGLREKNITGPKIVSDSLGFSKHQLGEMQQQLSDSGCTGVEFKSDPREPSFVQVHIGSENEKQKYMKSRGFHDRNGINGSTYTITGEELDAAKAMVCREFDDSREKIGYIA